MIFDATSENASVEMAKAISWWWRRRLRGRN
jgi:hypothetical protein